MTFKITATNLSMSSLCALYPCFPGELIKHYTVFISLLILSFISTYLWKLNSIKTSRWRHVNVDGMMAAKYLMSQRVGGTSGGTLATATCPSSSVLNIIIGVKCWSFYVAKCVLFVCFADPAQSSTLLSF